MKSHLLFVVLSIPTSLYAMSPSTEVRVTQLGSDSYEVKMTTSETTDVGTAQHMLTSGAARLCKEKIPAFGHYKFETHESLVKTKNSLPTLVLLQKITCITATSAAVEKSQATPDEWQPTQDQEEAIQRLTHQYFSNRDHGRFEEAYLMFSPSFKSTIRKDDWVARIQPFHEKAGMPIKRQISKITWYNNPASSPDAGVYAAADYTSQFQNIDIHCGFVIWKRQPNGSFQIIREEENYIDKTTQSTMKDSDIKRMQAQYGCVTR